MADIRDAILSRRLRTLMARERERPRKPHRPGRIPRPFLVMKRRIDDEGARPLLSALDPALGTLRIVDAKDDKEVTRILPKRVYRVEARVWNLGDAPAPAGLAELFVTDFATAQQWLKDKKTEIPLFDVAGFSAWPRHSAEIAFARRWTSPAKFVRPTFFVHAYDLVQDTVKQPFEETLDRHVVMAMLPFDGPSG